MREIKFRAWDKKNKIMHKEVGVHVEGWAMVFHTYKDFTPHKDIELMQFTGLKDIEGNEVWESDIIEFDRDEWGGDNNIFVVKWDEEEGAWNFGGGGSWKGDFSFRKVIGNIYENPELLEKGMK